VGPEGYAQRTSYAINRPGQPTRQLTRTVVVRAARDEREDDPNLPPTYDQAVTGKDRSVKVEDGAGGKPSNQPPPPRGAGNVPPPQGPPPSAPGPIPRFAPPPFSQVPRAQPSNTTTSTAHNAGGGFRAYLSTQPAPPNYSQAPPPAPPSAPVISGSRDSLDADDQTALLA
jgi:hypothetical protein